MLLVLLLGYCVRAAAPAMQVAPTEAFASIQHTHQMNDRSSIIQPLPYCTYLGVQPDDPYASGRTQGLPCRVKLQTG